MDLGTKLKKRKASAPDDEVAKVKKVKQMAADILPKKRKATGDAESNAAKKLKAPRAGLREDRRHSTSAKKVHPTQEIVIEAVSKKPKSASDVKVTGEKLTELKRGIDSNNNQDRSKKPNSTTSVPVKDDKDPLATDDSEEGEMDDQTDALLKGFESDNDEEKDPEDRGYEVGEEIPKIDQKTREKLKTAEKASALGNSGVIYVGRIPHGFYEQEMRQYFSQFGNITNLRLSRNRKTGKSKHFAFVEFESAEVAEIVSKTMDNYLLFGHILKCKLVAPEQIHKDLWIGANKRFKRVPWNKIQGHKLQQGMTESGWNKRIEKEERRRAEKKAALKLMDYEFESPTLKSAKGVSKNSQQSLTVTTKDESKEVEPSAIENQTTTADVKRNKQENKDTGATLKPISGVAETIEELAVATAASGKKKKSKNEKPSGKLEGAEELKISVSAEDIDTGLAEKVEEVKRKKKHRVT